MKGKSDHIVPLSEQALALFRELKTLAGDSIYVLPSLHARARHMGKDTINVAYKAMGYEGRFTPHGVRATASTILNGIGWRPDVIEKQLAHVERNKVRAVYNQAQYLAERKAMMQQWANHIDALCKGGNVISIKKVAVQ